MKRLFIILFCLICLAGCGDSGKKSNFSALELNELMDKIENKESFAAILTMEGCAWCEEAAPTFQAYAEDSNQQGYYVNFTQAKKEDHFDEDFADLKDYMYDILTVEDAERAFYVPHAIFVKEGKIVYDHIGTVETHDPYVSEMTPAEREELTSYYKTGFKKVFD